MTAAARDYDVISAVRDALVGTSQFDSVNPGGTPEEEGRTVGDTYAAYLAVSDFDEPTAYGSEDDGDDEGALSVRTVRYKLTLAVRLDDPEERDRAVDRLFGVAANVLNGVSLAELTLPALTRLRRGKLEKPKPPERRMTCWGEFVYVVADAGHATDD